MATLLTGAAGFIGSHVCKALLKQGTEVIGIDNLNDYYDVSLKEARLEQLEATPHFIFYRGDIADGNFLRSIATKHPTITHIIHLAAQAGVRYSLDHPFAYTHSNVTGHLTILELARHLPLPPHVMYASSSSVYGANAKLPSSIHDNTDAPISLYAATKKSCEMMSHVYAHLFKIPQTGLRFFTVYGPWGRPDMSAFIFTKNIIDGQPIRVFNRGEMKRNFTYIDDVVQAVIACHNQPFSSVTSVPHRLYNIGNNRSEPLLHFIALLEERIGKKAHLHLEAMQPGDVKETFADISETMRDFNFMPRTNIDEGLTHFVRWYKEYYHVD